MALAAALVSAVAAITLGLGAGPAQAATVTDGASLKLALTPGSDALISLGGPVTVADASLVIPRTVTLDLAGFDLTTNNITIASGVTFTLTDSSADPADAGTLTATGGYREAAITSTGATFTVGFGHVVAVGGRFGAGIGGGQNQSGGTVVIDDGIVEATGGELAPGIGSGYAGGVTDVTIRGGTVTAIGTDNGAGIGGGAGAAGGDAGTISIEGGTIDARGGGGATGIGVGVCGTEATITITAGQVTAQGGSNAAGIGSGSGCHAGVSFGAITIDGGDITATGGYFGEGLAAAALTIDGGTVQATAGDYASALNSPVAGGNASIGPGATVTAIGGTGASAVGLATSSLGSLDIAGDLILPSGSTLQVPASFSAVVQSTGTISGSGGISGRGGVDNHGVITLATANITVAAVTDRHYQIAFDPNDGSGATLRKVFATTFVEGLRTFPPDPLRAGRTFLGWNTLADGSGSDFTTTSVLTGTATGAPVASTVYAKWSSHLVLSPAGPSTAAGDSIAFTVEQFDDGGTSLGDVTAQTTLITSNGGSDPVTGNTILFTVAGTTTVTASLNRDPSTVGTTNVAVAAGEAASMTLTASDASVDQGDTITLTITGDDAYGNPVPGLAAEVDVSSDHGSDVINGMSVRFPGASTHILTATLRSNAAVVASASVVVTPTARGAVAMTGVDPTPTIALAGMLLALGLALILVTRVRRTRRSFSG